MLIECGHCGAPLDVQPNAATSRCRYCGTTSKVGFTRTLSPQTPPQWRPPPVWRPPVHVPASSDVELRYSGGGGSGGGGVIALFAILVVVGVVVALVVSKGSVLGVSPEQLDAVTFKETPAELKKKLGGSLSNDGKWLRVGLRGPFDYAVFQWDEKDMSHPNGVSFHASNRKVCTTEVEALRAKMRERLGPRFEGTSWHWTPLHINFDEKCSMVSLHVSMSSNDTADWKPAVEAGWKLLRADVFGRPGKPSEEELAGYLGVGYEASALAKVLPGSTVDDAETIVKKFPGTTLGSAGGLRAEIPLAHPRLGTLSASWENKKAGPLSSIDFRAYSNKLADHVGFAACLGKKLGTAPDVKETDYLKKQSNATLRIGSLWVNVSDSGMHAYKSGWDGMPPEAVRTLLLAVDGCAK